MAPTLFGKKTENCRTSGPPNFEVVSGKSTCMFSNSGTKIRGGNISLSAFHFQPNLLVRAAYLEAEPFWEKYMFTLKGALLKQSGESSSDLLFDRSASGE